jgi:hypothetical protein
MNSLSQLKRTPTFLIALLLVYPGLSPRAQAVNPPPDGDYPGENTAEGQDALFSLTSGRENTAIGFQALFSNTTAFGNTANGYRALTSNTDGAFNTASGEEALRYNTTGLSNTANGAVALFSNTNGAFNTANGLGALFQNTTGNYNTADGIVALELNTTGNNNTAIGRFALFNNSVGSGNTALGAHAGFHLTTGDNNIDIGNRGVRDESNTIRIGTQGTHTKTFIAGISDAAIGGMEVRVNQNGRLGTVPSSKRFKERINPMDKASEVLLSFRPVTFWYKPEIDPRGVPQFGLVAEDVEAVNSNLVVRNKEGKPYSVRYDAVNAMLLNEFLKEHKIVQEQGVTIATLQRQVQALTAGLKKVTAQLGASKPNTQVVPNGDKDLSSPREKL